MIERKGYPDGIVRYPVSVANQPDYNFASQESVDVLNKLEGEQKDILSVIKKDVSTLKQDLSDVKHDVSDLKASLEYKEDTEVYDE